MKLTGRLSGRLPRIAAIALAGSLAGVPIAPAGEPAPGPEGGRPPGPPGPSGARDSGRPGHPGPPPHVVWKKADLDKSGGISAEEFAGMGRPGKLPEEIREKIFKRLDKDGSGEIERREWPVDERGDRGRFQRMRELDKDQSGGLSFDEFRQSAWVARMPEDRQRKIFGRMDTNDDGQLDRSDRPNRRRGPRDEHARGAGFDRLDRNDDGFVDFEEFRAGPEVRELGEDSQEDRFEALDRNDDLKLDRGELDPPGPQKGDRRGRRGPRGPEDRKDRPGPPEEPAAGD